MEFEFIKTNIEEGIPYETVRAFVVDNVKAFYEKFENESESGQENNIINIGDKVVIGDDIANVTSATSSSIVIDKTIYVKEDTPIYRVAYEAKLNTKLVEVDEETHLETIVSGSENIYNLTLKSVINNGNNKSLFSDRLIFETNNDVHLKEFNRAELQIK